MSRTTINTNWERLFRHVDLFLFNQAPYLDNKLLCEVDPKGEVLQWYLIKPSDKDYVESLVCDSLSIVYSEILDEYVLPVCHWGTSWEDIPVKVMIDDYLVDQWHN
jgi:hypothetical protein